MRASDGSSLEQPLNEGNPVGLMGVSQREFPKQTLRPGAGVSLSDCWRRMQAFYRSPYFFCHVGVGLSGKDLTLTRFS
jgi:hypothetical protein